MIFEESSLGFGGVGWLGNLPDSGCNRYPTLYQSWARFIIGCHSAGKHHLVEAIILL